MKKFKMECEICGQPIEVSTGIFAKKHFTCECGHVTKVVKIVKEECPKCGEEITYDRSKDMSPICPSCHYVIERETRFKEAIKKEKERKTMGIESDPWITVNLSEMFNHSQKENDIPSQEQS